MVHILRVLVLLVSLSFVSTMSAADDALTFKSARDAQAKFKKAKAALEKTALDQLDELRDSYIADLTPARKKALMEDDLDEAQRIATFTKRLAAEKGTRTVAEPAEAFTSKDAKQAQEKFQKAKTATDEEQTTALKKLREDYVVDLTAARKQALAADDLDEAQRIVAAIKEANLSPLLEKFQGAWIGVSGNVNPEGYTIVWEGDKHQAYGGDRLCHKGTFKIDTSKSPNTFDYTPDYGTFKGDVILGIYEFDGDTLRMCYVLASSKKARPTDFSTANNDGNVLQVWKRKEK